MTKISGNRIEQLVTKKRVIIFTTLWFIGGILLLAAMSDLFTQTIFKKRHLLLLALLALNTFFIFKMWRIYLNKKPV